MCIAIYKPAGMPYPSKKTLKTCFENNPDGAGYMIAVNDCVKISKGFTTFSAFWKAFSRDRERVGNAPSAVLHFRISTQAGTRPDCTHPFPLSRKMDDLRKLECYADIGIAHNGVISLTSHYYDKNITHSDTMEFITEYASRIIKGRDYYKDADALYLLEELAGSRLAILDGAGHCELLGDGWREDGGLWYSNASYKPKAPIKSASHWWSLAGDKWSGYYAVPYSTDLDEAEEVIEDKYEAFYDADTGLYDFGNFDCPATVDGDVSYCDLCAQCSACYSG